MGADGGEEKEATGGVPWAPLHWAPRPGVQQMTNRENKCPHHSLGLLLPLPACLPRRSGDRRGLQAYRLGRIRSLSAAPLGDS